MNKIKFVYIIFVFAAIAVAGCARANPEEAEASARAFAENVPDATGKVSCARADSDGDGYVTCTVFRASGDPIGIECGAERWCWLNCAEGCKMLQPKIHGGRR